MTFEVFCTRIAEGVCCIRRRNADAIAVVAGILVGAVEFVEVDGGQHTVCDASVSGELIRAAEGIVSQDAGGGVEDVERLVGGEGAGAKGKEVGGDYGIREGGVADCARDAGVKVGGALDWCQDAFFVAVDAHEDWDGVDGGAAVGTVEVDVGGC